MDLSDKFKFQDERISTDYIELKIDSFRNDKKQYEIAVNLSAYEFECKEHDRDDDNRTVTMSPDTCDKLGHTLIKMAQALRHHRVHLMVTGKLKES